MPNKSPIQFLDRYILDTLAQNGLANLTQANQELYLPQLLAQAYERLGMAFLNKLDDQHSTEYFALLERAEEMPPEQWRAFWDRAIPDLEQVVTDTLDLFAADCRQILNDFRK